MFRNYAKYTRHLVLPDFNISDQDKLTKAKILCIGAGGLGSPALTYLSIMGIGNIDIIDYDNVEFSNLNRQFIFTEKNINQNKAVLTKKYIKNINKKLNCKIYTEKLTDKNITAILKNYNIVLDCTDNLKTKLLINNYALNLNIPVIHGAIFGYEGYVTILQKNKICLNCIYTHLKINECTNYGVYGPSAGIVGIIQASETIKFLIKKETLNRKIFFINLKNLKCKLININKNNTCNVC